METVVTLVTGFTYPHCGHAANAQGTHWQRIGCIDPRGDAMTRSIPGCLARLLAAQANDLAAAKGN